MGKALGVAALELRAVEFLLLVLILIAKLPE